MKKIILLLVLLAFYNPKAQNLYPQKPNYDIIAKSIKDPFSSLYYKKLLVRLTNCDTTLNIEEYRHLYYGYTFQKEYKPYHISQYEDELSKYYQSSFISPKDYDKIIKLAKNSIEDFPFDLRQLNFLGYIYHLKGEEMLAKQTSLKFIGILNAIMSSGDGKTSETAYHVISVSHEYVFLNFFDFKSKQQSLIGSCDYLSLEKNEKNIEGIYFNVGILFKKLSEK